MIVGQASSGLTPKREGNGVMEPTCAGDAESQKCAHGFRLRRWPVPEIPTSRFSCAAPLRLLLRVVRRLDQLVAP